MNGYDTLARERKFLGSPGSLVHGDVQAYKHARTRARTGAPTRLRLVLADITGRG